MQACVLLARIHYSIALEHMYYTTQKTKQAQPSLFQRQLRHFVGVRSDIFNSSIPQFFVGGGKMKYLLNISAGV
jgi:hypothetical protein